jgi:hypothetical protein
VVQAQQMVAVHMHCCCYVDKVKATTWHLHVYMSVRALAAVAAELACC